MSNNHQPSDNYPSESTDDAFWAALFAQEESQPPLPSAADADASWKEVPFPAKEPKVCQEKSQNHQDPWKMAEDVLAADEAVQLRVTGHNKGGLLVDWHGLQGFIPASQLVDFPQFHLEIERITALKKWQDKQVEAKIIEVNQAQNRLIFSERATLVEAHERKRLLNEISVGEHIKGAVTNLTDFGAFVDLGGVEGLIHISELSWSRVTHPGEIVQPNQEVTVRVLNVDVDNGRVALSLKRLKKDPWKTVDERFAPGQMVEGVVSKVVSFGAFVQIEDELEGLIHISELAEGTFLHPRNVVRRGQRVRARVLHVDGAEKRLALSLRGVSS